MIASLEKDKQYHDFVKLSPYRQDDVEICRLLFLDADYVRKQERHFKAYYPKVEIVYGRGVVTLIGDMMWHMPNIASTASSTVGEHGINILNLDAQEETSRILIVVEDKGTNVSEAVKAIHSKRPIRVKIKMTEGKIWMDGSLVPWDDAKIHVLTHGLHYGTVRIRGNSLLQNRQWPRRFPFARPHTTINAQCKDVLIWTLDILRNNCKMR